MSYQDDSQLIIDRLTDELEGICSKYWSGWITETRKGVQVGLMTPRIKGKTKKPTSSFTVTLSGAKRGSWYRFSAGFGGGVLALLYYSETGREPNGKDGWREAFKIARQFLGMEAQSEVDPAEREARETRRAEERAEREARAAEQDKRAAEAREERVLDAKEVWVGTQPLSGSLGDVYLQARGMPPVSEWPWDCGKILRFHPALECELDRRSGRWPTLVGKVCDSFGSGVGIWQVYLSRDGNDKAPLANAKVGRGPAGGGAVRIGGDGPSIGIAEGMETAMAAWFLNGCKKPVWAALSTSGIIGFEPPAFVERIEIFPDGDKANAKQYEERGSMGQRPGIRAAHTLRDRMLPILGQGNVSVAQEPTAGRDYLDVFNAAKAKGLL